MSIWDVFICRRSGVPKLTQSDWEHENDLGQNLGIEMKKRKIIVILITGIFLSLWITAGAVFADDRQDLTLSMEEELLTETASPDPIQEEDNDTLLSDYLEISLGISNEPMYSVFGAGKRLSGADRKAYDKLKEKAKKVADGSLTSTVFGFYPSDLGLKSSYTASELQAASGITVSSLGTCINGKINLSSAAQNALNKLLPDMSNVITALLFDCPYELYWYNKSSSGGCDFSAPYSVSYSGSDGKISKLVFKDSSDSITYSLAVADEYASGTYTVNSKKIAAVRKAVSNIEAIVSQNAAYGDFEKLSAYKTKICDLVSYNHSAAGDPSVPYGNPWQLIWVFDGDPSTNVVCEGYSKAFQYLCDLSTFESSKVESRMVSGVMQGGTGAGGHMWNIVTMDDGKNYLVDVTNCDTGTVGAPDKLFLAGGSASGTADYVVSKVAYRYNSDTRNFYSSADLSISASKYAVQAPVDISGAVVGSLSAKTYTGKAIKPVPKVTLAGCALVNNTDFTLSYKNNVNVGTATIRITGKGRYTGSISKTFRIKAKAVTPKVKLPYSVYTYNGKTKKPVPVVSVSGTVLDASQYDIAYDSGRKNVGVYNVSVTLKGNYTGSGKASFKIRPQSTELVSLAAASKGFTVKWKKQATQTSGYQIQYNTNKSFSSGNKSVLVNGNANVSRKISGLQSGKTYFVRIRTFRTIGNTRIYSTWSAAKGIRIK
ncbi:MAG: hypothetical protein IKF90_26310 [Parasporobacterium sp.]|nr:hypothetical protein [Parasporobacterium sp.]